MSHQEGHRQRIMRQIGIAIRPDGQPSEEKQEATLEALLCVAATMFAVVHEIPPDKKHFEELANAAGGGLYGWLDDYKKRN